MARRQQIGRHNIDSTGGFRLPSIFYKGGRLTPLSEKAVFLPLIVLARQERR
jgi:hypothetical protein